MCIDVNAQQIRASTDEQDRVMKVNQLQDFYQRIFLCV